MRKWKGTECRLLALLESVRTEAIVVSSDFYRLINIDDTSISEYRSDIESILGERLIFFGILKNIEPLYIHPIKVPREVSIEVERFEIDLRNFIKTKLLNHYTATEIVFKELKTIFRGNLWDQINKKMIKDLESDYYNTKDTNIKSAIELATKAQLDSQLLFDRFFEAMVMGNLVKIIDDKWGMIFQKPFDNLQKSDVLARLNIIKEDRNIKSHPKSRIPTTFKTLTHIYEFKNFIN